MGFFTPLSASVILLLPLVGNDLHNALDRRLRRWLAVTSRTRKVPIVRPVPRHQDCSSRTRRMRSA
jgi:hypothetical protein